MAWILIIWELIHFRKKKNTRWSPSTDKHCSPTLDQEATWQEHQTLALSCAWFTLIVQLLFPHRFLGNQRRAKWEEGDRWRLKLNENVLKQYQTYIGCALQPFGDTNRDYKRGPMRAGVFCTCTAHTIEIYTLKLQDKTPAQRLFMWAD